MRYCIDYVGSACVDGRCPQADRAGKLDCENCWHYEGCRDCANAEFCKFREFFDEEMLNNDEK